MRTLIDRDAAVEALRAVTGDDIARHRWTDFETSEPAAIEACEDAILALPAFVPDYLSAAKQHFCFYDEGDDAVSSHNLERVSRIVNAALKIEEPTSLRAVGRVAGVEPSDAESSPANDATPSNQPGEAPLPDAKLAAINGTGTLTIGPKAPLTYCPKCECGPECAEAGTDDECQHPYHKEPR